MKEKCSGHDDTCQLRIQNVMVHYFDRIPTSRIIRIFAIPKLPSAILMIYIVSLRGRIYGLFSKR
jgi:hypothetical protein